MTCEETRHFLNAYVDGELEWSRKLAIEGHLQGCLSCSGAFASLRSLVSAMETGELKFKAPQHLKAMVQASLHRETPRVRESITSWQWVGSAAAVLLIVALFWVVSLWKTSSAVETQVMEEIISSHVRSMMADHLTDVTSSNTHNVKPWFADKLDYSPPAKDLGVKGFPLVGGRMDYLENRPVAALVYQRNQHIINLFVWPVAESPATPEVRSAARGYNLIHWSQAGMTYWLISDLNPDELSECANLLRE